MESKNICPICLRTNRKLKVIPTALSEYHDELTNYILPLKNQHYCCDCEYLLRKTYNFHHKCTNAAKILKDWMNSSAKNKTPADLLHEKLPPITLAKWVWQNNNVINYTCADSLEDPIVIEDHVTVKPDIDTVLVPSISQTFSNNASRDGNIESTIHSEKTIKVEFEDVSDSCIQNFNQSEKMVIEFDIDDTNQIENNIQNLTHVNMLKEENVMTKNEDISRDSNVSSNISFDSDIEDNALKLVCFSDNDKKRNIVFINDKDEYSDDSSVSIDDSDDHLNSHKKNKMKKETHDEITDDNLDDDYESDRNKRTTRSNKEDFNLDKLLSTENRIMSYLENVNKTLDTICEDWKVSLLADVNSVDQQTRDDVRKMTRTFLTERRRLHPGRRLYVQKLNVLSKIKFLNADIDMLNEMCHNTMRNYKNGLYGPKERLITTLKNWGKLKTEGGFVFDKNIIINRLDVVSDKIVQRLLNLMHGKKRLHPDAARVLKMIQKNPKQLSTQFESVFDIEYLSTEKDKLEEFERRKTYECYVKAEYKCELCYQGFKSEKYLEYHKKMHDEKQGQFSCHICHVRHYSKEGHRKHMLLHKEVFKCKLCPLVTYYRDSMINHFEQHKGTIYECGKCGNNYKSRSAFMFHQSRAHPRGDHVCSICGNAFVSEQGLHSHALRKHRGESPAPADGSGFSCEECTLTFPSEEACVRHRKITHGLAKRRRGASTTADKGSKEAERGARGAATQRGAVPRKLTKPRRKPVMTCPECNAVGESYGWMVKHFNIEHPTLDIATSYGKKQVYLCDICGKEFGNKYGLRDHIGIHIGLSFPCPTCNKQFGSQQKLNQHRRWHGPPTYCCERCGKKFHSASNLNNHMRTHIGERSFKCQICGKGFLHRCSLNAHIRGVHNHQRRNRKRGATSASHEAAGAVTRAGDEAAAVLDTRAGGIILNSE